MKITSIRLNKEIIDRINELKKEYELKNQSETIGFVLNFIDKYHINLKMEFHNQTIENILIGTNKTLKNLSLIEDNLEAHLIKNDKNTLLIIRMLRAFERDYLIPIKHQEFKKIEAKVAKELKEKYDREYDEKLAEKERVSRGKIHALESELLREKHNFESIMKEKNGIESNYERLKSKFSKSSLTGRFSITLSELEYNNLS